MWYSSRMEPKESFDDAARRQRAALNRATEAADMAAENVTEYSALVDEHGKKQLAPAAGWVGVPIDEPEPYELTQVVPPEEPAA